MELLPTLFCSFQMESRSKSHEVKKTAVKREHVPAVNMEDSPPVSDSDVSTGAVLSMRMGRGTDGS